MSDPTIPELVARLREIDSEWGDNWTLGIDEAGNLLVLDGEGEFVGALHEDSDRLAEAVCELRKALPVILDALDHIGDANKMVAHSPDGGKVEDEPGPLSSDGVCPFCNCYTDTPHTWRDCAHDLRETAQGLAERAERVTRDSVAAILRVRGRLAEFRLRVSEAAGCTRVVTDVTPDPFTAASDDVALETIRGLRERATWRPIEECGELERGRYLVQLRSGAQIVALWSGDSEGWVLRQRDLDEFDSPRDITHVHQMGPIRGPGETR